MVKTVVKCYLNGNEYIFKEREETPSSGWQPGANTIAYRPLAEDLNDVVGNYNLTAVGGNYNFTQNQQGKTCIELNPQDSDMTYLTTGVQSNSVFDFANNDYTFVGSVCDFSSTVIGGRSGANLFGLAPQVKFIGIRTDGDPDYNGWTAGDCELFNGFVTDSGPNNWYDTTGSDFINIIVTWDHANLTLTSYVNGTLNIQRVSQEASFNDMQYQFNVCMDQYDPGDPGRYVHGKVKDLIIEDRVWTLQEIQDYTV